MNITNFFYLGGVVVISNGLPYLISLIVSVVASPEVFGEFAYFLNVIVVCSTLIGFVGHAYIANNYFRSDPDQRHTLLFKSVLYLSINLLIALCLVLICVLFSRQNYTMYIYALLGASGLYVFRVTSVYLQMQQNPLKLFKFSSCFGVCFLALLSALWLLGKSTYVVLASSYIVAGLLVFGIVVYEIKKTVLMTASMTGSMMGSIAMASGKSISGVAQNYFKHLKAYLLIYLNAVLMILFPFLDKALVRSNFGEVELAGYYFSFTFSMIYLLFSELLMKSVMPNLMQRYVNGADQGSKKQLLFLRVNYSGTLFFLMLVFLLSYTFVLDWFPQYQFTQEFFYLIAISQFVLTQLKYDNVYFVAFKRGSALLYSSAASFVLYSFGLLYLDITSLTELAFLYFIATALWWSILVLAKVFFSKLSKNETIFS